jgi:hypothetical protein
MRKKIYDPNQLNIEFPEENIDKKEEKISENTESIENTKNIENDNLEAFAIAQEKELDLIASQKAQEEALNNINTFPVETGYERDDPGEIYKIPERYYDNKNKERKEKEKGRIFDDASMAIIRGTINDFREKVISDIAFNGDFSDKNDASDFNKIKQKVSEHLRYGREERANKLNQGMGVLRRVSNIKKMLQDFKHQKFIDYMDNLKTDKGVTCGLIVNSKEYDEIMDIIKQNRR